MWIRYIYIKSDVIRLLKVINYFILKELKEKFLYMKYWKLNINEKYMEMVVFNFKVGDFVYVDSV